MGEGGQEKRGVGELSKTKDVWKLTALKNKELEWWYPAWVENASHKRHELLNKNSVPGVKYLPKS